MYGEDSKKYISSNVNDFTLQAEEVFDEIENLSEILQRDCHRYDYLSGVEECKTQ